VMTGHEAADKPARRGLTSPPAADTLVVLMGLENLGSIARALVAQGRPADTPVAVIQAGTTRAQATVTGTLATIAVRVRAAALDPPAVIVVGEVVTLRSRLKWFESSRGRRALRARALPAQS
jgi:siroheme synthase